MPRSIHNRPYYYIYCLICPMDLQVKYVGMAYNVQKRVKGHMNNRKYDSNLEKAKWLIVLKDNKLSPEYKILDKCSSIEEAEKKETYWIEYYRKIGTIFNITKGGLGTTGYSHSQETLRKIDENSGADRRKVNQYTKEGVYITTYPSRKKAAEAIGKTCRENISRVCKGARKIAGGYQWRFYEDDPR